MCSHYQAIKEAERLRRRFGIELPPDLGKYDVWPGYGAFFIRRPAEADNGAALRHRQPLSSAAGSPYLVARPARLMSLGPLQKTGNPSSRGHQETLGDPSDNRTFEVATRSKANVASIRRHIAIQEADLRLQDAQLLATQICPDASAVSRTLWLLAGSTSLRQNRVFLRISGGQSTR